MTKRLLSLLLAVIMLLSLCLTACSSGSDEDEDEEDIAAEADALRPYVAVTIYAIAEDSMTEEALKAVEEKVSNYCIARYKTSIDLRFFKASEYASALNSLYDKFAAQDAADKEAAEIAASSSKAESEYKKTLTVEERRAYDRKKRLEDKAKKEAEKKQQKEEAALVEAGKDKAVEAKEVQMDIVFLPTMQEYYSAVDQGLLMDIKSLLDNRFKLVTDYVFPTYLTAATVDGGIYGIPTNQGVVTNETYFVVNKALAEKYNVDWEQVRSITDLTEVFAQVKAGEPGVTPIYGDFDPENVVFYHPTEDIDAGNFLVVNTDQLLGASYSAANYSKSYTSSATGQQFHDYAKLKSEYRQAGFLSETNQNFFLSVQELSEEERFAKEEEGYLTILYKGAQFTSEAALDHGVYAISKRSKNSDRAMEILQLMYTDETLHNLLAFGIEDVNYVVNSDGKTVTVIDDSYAMDLFHTGNTFLGYLPEGMDPDYVEKSIQKNLNSRLDPFMGLRIDWSNPAQKEWLDIFQSWHDAVGNRFDQLMYGVPNYEEIYQALVTETASTDYVTKTYTNFRDENIFTGVFKTNAALLITLDANIHFTTPAES